MVFRKLEQHQVVWPSTIITTVIGKATASALSQWQIRVDNIPAIADSEHVLQLESLQLVQNQTILLVKGEGGRVDIGEELRRRGARLVGIETYRRVLPETDEEVVDSLWHDDSIDIILFTSQEAMHNLFFLLGEKAHAWLRSIPCIVISERLAKVASLLGMKTIIVSQYDSLLSGLEQYANDLNSRSVPKLRIDP